MAIICFLPGNHNCLAMPNILIKNVIAVIYCATCTSWIMPTVLTCRRMYVLFTKCYKNYDNWQVLNCSIEFLATWLFPVNPQSSIIYFLEILPISGKLLCREFSLQIFFPKTVVSMVPISYNSNETSRKVTFFWIFCISREWYRYR